MSFPDGESLFLFKQPFERMKQEMTLIKRIKTWSFKEGKKKPTSLQKRKIGTTLNNAKGAPKEHQSVRGLSCSKFITTSNKAK